MTLRDSPIEAATRGRADNDGPIDDGVEVLEPRPRPLLSVLRQALIDFYFNSWRLAPANLIWAIVVVGVLVVASIWLPAIALAVVAAVPLAGIYRLAALIARGRGPGFSDFVAGMTRFWRPALAIGAAGLLLGTVFTTNVFVGLAVGGPAGWLLSAFALYADFALAMILVSAWPLLADPLRDDVPLRRRLKLAVAVTLARPGRLAMLTILLVALLVLSTVFFAALVTVSMAYVSLVATRFVLPIADRLEGRTGRA